MTEAEEKLIELVLNWFEKPILKGYYEHRFDRMRDFAKAIIVEREALAAHPYGAIAESMLVEPRNVMPESKWSHFPMHIDRHGTGYGR